LRIEINALKDRRRARRNVADSTLLLAAKMTIPTGVANRRIWRAMAAERPHDARASGP
jgi:hypothetical protein